MDLKPDTGTGYTGFCNGQVGNLKDLFCKEKAKAGLFPKTPVKDSLFDFDGHPDTIIFVEKHDAVFALFIPYADGSYVLPMLDGIINKVEKDAFEKRAVSYTHLTLPTKRIV